MLAGILRVDDFNGLDSNLSCPFVAPVSIESNQPCSSSDTLTLRRITGDMRQQRWEITARLYPAYRHEFLVHSCLHGYARSFAVRPPQIDRKPGETAIREVHVEAAGGDYWVGYRYLYLSALPDHSYFPGDFITIQDQASTPYRKLHIVEKQFGGQLFFWPGLVRTLEGDITIYAGKKAKGYFFIDQDTKLGVTYTDGILSDPGQISLIEDCS